MDVEGLGSGIGQPILPLGGESVLVIGGGFLGRRIAAVALARGLATTVLTRGRRAPLGLMTTGARLVIGDAADADLVARQLRRRTHVIHCAGGRYPAEAMADPLADATETLAPVLAVLDALARRPGSRLTFLSSGGTVYGRAAGTVGEDHPCRPVSAYGVSRLAAEQYVATLAGTIGLPARILRLGNVYGPDQDTGRGQGLVAALLDSAATGAQLTLFGRGDTVRDWVHVDDVADVVHRLPAPPTGASSVLNVGTGQGVAVNALVTLVEECTGAPLGVRWAPAREWDIPRSVLGVHRLQATVSWSPRSVCDGVPQTWAAISAAPWERALAR